MKYYSTNHQAPVATLHDAVEQGLAPDRGLYMPEQIRQLSEEFYLHIEKLSFQEIAFEVATTFFGDDFDEASLKHISYGTLTFDKPLV